MPIGDLRVTDDASPGAWIAPRLGGDFGAVTLAVPAGADHINKVPKWPELGVRPT
jgi:hypothetical protein